MNEVLEPMARCAECPRDPMCEGCPDAQPKLPDAPVAVQTKKVRKAWDANTMGFGKHKYEYIDPDEIPLDYSPPNGIARRDFNLAFNKKHPDTDMTLDAACRPGATFETNLVGKEGIYEVAALPKRVDGVAHVQARKEGTEEVVLLSGQDLGFIADRIENVYTQTRTRLLRGASANKGDRQRLTQKTEESYATDRKS